MTKTPDLIEAWVECATPVRRLRPPLVRAGLWLGFAGLILALLAIGHGVRGGLAERLHQLVFAVSIAAALATGILAAVAAFRPRPLLLAMLTRFYAFLTAGTGIPAILRFTEPRKFQFVK